MRRGIDVSYANGKLNWVKLKAEGVEFAIIRIGYGGDYPKQDDDRAEYNMKECERLGIPYGVYIYSYALNNTDVESEIDHTLRMVKGHKIELGVYFDMEDADGYKAKHGINVYKSRELLTGFCTKFCESVERAGYKAGVYANYDYFKNVLYIDKLRKWSIWLAHWQVSKPGIECDIWQYTSDGTFNGAVGRFDMNYLYNDVVAKPNKKKSNEEIAQEVLDDKWGRDKERKDRLTQAGYDYNAVQAIVNKLVAERDTVFHEIKPGETLTSIAEKFGTTVEKLAELNNIKNVDYIIAGHTIRVK